MSLRELIESEIKVAMRARDELTRDTLRMVMSDVKKAELEVDQELDDGDVQAILAKAAKTRLESIEQFDRGGRADLADKERAELAVLQCYLPSQLSEAQTRALVERLLGELEIASRKDLGRLMKAVMAQHRGQVDGKRVQAIAGELLDS